MMQAVEGQLQPIRDAKLVVDLTQVILDHLLSGTNLIGNFLIAHPTSDAADDGKFFPGELRLNLRIGESRRLSTICLNNTTDRLVIDPGFAICNLPNTLHQQIWCDGTRNHPSHPATVKLHGCLLYTSPSPRD